MLFARDKSQMCNNLLQFAHVYAWGREHGRKSMSMRFSYKYKFFKISSSRLVSFPMYLFAKYAAALRILPTASFKYENCDVEALEKKMLRHRNIVVSGWYARWYDLFLKYRNEICDMFEIDERYTSVVKTKMIEAESNRKNVIRLGVHIRRGDYAIWKNGIYCYDNDTYINYIQSFASLYPESEVHVYLSTNDPGVSVDYYQSQLPAIVIHLLAGSPPEDMLSECDYVMGPPSTFSLVAVMYRDIPLCRMDTVSAGQLTKEAFLSFDYWFRRIV